MLTQKRFALRGDQTLGWVDQAGANVSSPREEKKPVFDWIFPEESRCGLPCFHPFKNQRLPDIQVDGECRGNFSTKFDWWQVSFNPDGWFPSAKLDRSTGETEWHGRIQYFGELLSNKYSSASWEHAKGHHGYEFLDTLKLGERRILSIAHGGSHDSVNITVSGSETNDTREYLLSVLPPDFRVSRVDSAFDSRSGEAGFKAVTEWAVKKAKEAGIKSRWWISNDSEDGNTLYIGSKTSRVQIRIYEKGKQLGFLQDEWWRAEIQVRPRTTEKEGFGRLSSGSVWGATRFSRDLWEKLTGDYPACLDVGYKEPVKDLEHRLLQLAIQYGNLLSEALAIHGSGNAVIAVCDRVLIDIGKPAITGRLPDVPNCPF